ncbi:CAP-D2 condensin subunit [Carabus blaptoides fortunei]
MEFNIPIDKESLLESHGSYYVRDVCVISSMKNELERAKNTFQSEGPEYILEYFDIYYSLIYHSEKLGINVISNVVDDLAKPIKQLNIYLDTVLTEQDIDTDVQLKAMNILKMLVYVYTNILIIYENKIDAKYKETLLMKSRKVSAKRKHDEEEFKLEDKLKQMSLLLEMLQVPIYKLWEPPICEEQFINLIADTCFSFLQNQTIKHQKDTWQVIFHMFGVLLKNYSYSLTFTVRLIQAIKDREHLEQIVPSGIKILVQEYNCRSLVRELVRELTEWQIDEKYQDTAGTRHCANTLIEMTGLMPELMLPEVVYLLKYLSNNSYTLRNCVLSVVTEVVIKVLCNEGMSEEQKQIRNQLLSKLKAHICDKNSYVRSKTLQNWARLHTQSSIPLEMQIDILDKAKNRILDVASNVRKSALQLLTIFLKCNPYSPTLNLDFYEQELEKEITKFRTLKPEGSDTMEAIKRKELEWAEMEEGVRSAIEEFIDLESPEDEVEIDHDMSSKKVETLIVEHLTARRYKEAFLTSKLFGCRNKETQEKLDNLDTEEQINFYFTYMYSLYNEISKQAAALVDMELNRAGNMTTAQMEEIKTCEESIKFLTDVVKFLKIVDSVIPIIRDLLTSTVLGDVQESIDFLVTAHQFQLKNTSQGLAAMLTLMNSTEQDRKKVVIEAYKKIFLSYEGNAKEKANVIVTRLISLLKTINVDDVVHLSTVVSQWTANGDIDNSTIELLWNMFTGKATDVVQDDQVAALQLLSMAALSRKTIVERNMNLISELVFRDKGTTDPRLVINACNMLSIMGNEEVDMDSTTPCFRISLDDPMWENLVQVLMKAYRKRDPFCHSILSAAIEFVYKVCRKPEVFCTKLVKGIIQMITDSNSKILINNKIDPLHLSCFVHILGIIAIRQFCFLDVTVYKELKRRVHVREKKKKDSRDEKKKKKDKSILDISKASASSRLNLPDRIDDCDESFLEGAIADDTEAEFILNVCENEIVTANLLGQYTHMLIHIIKHPSTYADRSLQASTALALTRFMTVSSRLCQDNLQLLMTVLEKSKYPSVKNNIIVGLADMLHRFPNVIEPWSAHLYKTVKDENETVRITAVTIISKLIMEDMLRVKGTIADVALCIVDECPEIVRMTEDFFRALTQKNNVIYNVFPDIVSRLSNDMNQINEDVFRKVLTFLVSLIDKDKQMESLVDKLCMRLSTTEKVRVWRDIAFCLTLLNQNERSLGKMEENFGCFKTRLEDDAVYDLLISIVHKYRNSSKDEVKSVAMRLEQLFRNGEITQEDLPLNDNKRKSTKSSRRGKKARQ